MIRRSLAFVAALSVGCSAAASASNASVLARKLPRAQSQRLSRGVERLSSTGFVSGVPALRIPSLVMADPDASIAPPAAVAASWDDATAFAYGAALGKTARARGADVLALPLGSYGSAPLLAARLAPGLVRGVQSAHVVAAVVGRNGGGADVVTLHERDLPPIEAAIANGAGAVACASRGGRPSSLCANRRLLASILTREVRFFGFAIGNPYGNLATPARIVTTLERIGALEHPPHRSADVANVELSRRIVQNGAVLLKNDASVLPLDPATLSSLALIGADAPTQAAVAAAFPRSTVVPADAAGAVAAARRAQAAIVVLGPVSDAAEGALVAAVTAANPRTAVVLERDTTAAPDWSAAAPALLWAWSPTRGTPRALANLVSGRSDPCGKLPFALSGAGGATAFAFGAGLSYASFAYSKLTVSYGKAADPHPVTVRFTLRNTGSVGGTEVAQLYLSAPAGSGGPSNGLVGFVRVALRPGQERRLSIPLAARAFAAWSPSYKAWYVAPGTYAASVGGGSGNIVLTGNIQIVGRS